jgi:excisionase family DNA binding protein
MTDNDICLTCEWPGCVGEPGGPPKSQCAWELSRKRQRPGPAVPDGYMAMERARRRLGIGYHTIKKLIASGKCPAVRTGNSKRATIAIPEEWVENFNK